MAPSAGAGRRVKHALIMPGDIVGDDVQRLVEFGVAAEEAGWDGFFPYDILVNPLPPDDPDAPWVSQPGEWDPPEYKPFADPWIVLAGVAARTERITLGTWITPLARRQPWQVARDVATLDRLSNGRVIFGAGLGKRMDYEKFGMDWDARAIAKRYDEALEIIDRFWRGERVTFEGEHFTINNVALLPTTVQEPRVPILVAGFWPNKQPFRRGARWDGIMPVFGAEASNTKSPEELVREMLTWYHSITDEPGEIFMPYSPGGESDEYVPLCKELGTTWFYSAPTREWLGSDLEHIQQGPPED